VDGNKDSEKRVKTLRKRLGAASDLIKDDAYLPLFRNRQIRYPKEFEESIVQAQRKEHPDRWFAKVWSCANTFDSLKMLAKYVARRVAEYAKKVHDEKLEKQMKRINPDGLLKLAELKKQRKSVASNLLL
jgi:hypothetical protein